MNPYSPFNPDLLTDLAHRRVVLFLGAGVSASAVTATGGRIADWGAFLSKCANDVPEKLKLQVKKLLGENDYLLACELLQGHFAEQWAQLVSAEFGQKANPSPLHHALLGLRQRIILTTNFDKIIENAWGNSTDGVTHFPVTISSIDNNIFRPLKDHERNYIIKIHGSVDNPNSLIFSRSEYIRMAFGNSNYNNFIESLLLNYTFLFVGFSMNDPAIVSLMEMYALKYPDSRPHYIFSGDKIDDNVISMYKRLRKLVLIEYDPVDNHSVLPVIISDLVRQSRERYRLLVSEMLATLGQDGAVGQNF